MTWTLDMFRLSAQKNKIGLILVHINQPLTPWFSQNVHSALRSTHNCIEKLKNGNPTIVTNTLKLYLIIYFRESASEGIKGNRCVGIDSKTIRLQKVIKKSDKCFKNLNF